MKFIDLFAGMGGFGWVLEQKGCECVFANDINKHTKVIYDKNHNCKMTLSKLEDIDIADIPDFDMLTAGFPCQPFSVNGLRQGFNDKHNRGNAIFNIFKILEFKKPSVFLLENVYGLVSHDKGNTLKRILDHLTIIGYYVKTCVMNSKYYGNLPQNRNRIYIVGFKEKIHYDSFSFPDKIPLENTWKQYLESDIEEKYYLTSNFKKYEQFARQITDFNAVYSYQFNRMLKMVGICPTTQRRTYSLYGRLFILDEEGRIRALTPRECANLQGYPSNFQLEDVIDSHLYSMIGNSIAIPVIDRIIENMLDVCSNIKEKI